MSLAEHQDAWVLSKQITPDRLAKLKDMIGRHSESALRAANQARRDIVFAKDFAAFYAAVDALAVASRSLSHVSHWMKFVCDWTVAPLPEFNDQFINQFYLLPEFRRTYWLEGAVFCGLGIEPGQRILELCCGMGWYTNYFYSPFASEIVAVDFDPRAIELAKHLNQQANIKYQVMDIRDNFPMGPFATVIWDGAIEHFTKKEIDNIMRNIRAVMASGARLVGYTVGESEDDPQLPTHEMHFQGIAHLGRLLKEYFKNVRVFERLHPTISPPRHNLFFYASDDVLPFDQDWKPGLRL